MSRSAPTMNTWNLGPLVDDVSLDMYHAATGLQQSGNLMVSPLSMLYATVLIYLGAKGNTKSNLDSSLHFSKTFPKSNSADVAAAFGQLMGQFKLSNFEKTTAAPKNQNGPMVMEINHGFRDAVSEKLQLTLANAVFIENSFTVNQTYLDIVSRELKAAAIKKDFKNKPEPARADINTWVEERTGGKIKDLIPKGVINGAVKAVLANAVYFKASWDNLFDESQTKKEKFTLLGGNSQDVDMMHKWGERYPYTEDSDMQYLEIPYASNEASLLVFLPKDKKGLRNLEKSITSDKLHKMASAANGDQKVDLSFPKFKFEGKFNMKDLLKKIGITDIFDSGKADLSGIAPGLVISEAFHKTYIDLNEKGTEAAAASAAIGLLGSSFNPHPEVPVPFVADHPFMFAIRHNPSKTILFIGRVENPQS